MANATEMTDIPYPAQMFIWPKINIKLKNPIAIMCPAEILANNRTINTKGFVNIPVISIIGIKGIGIFSHQGTPGALKICFQ